MRLLAPVGLALACSVAAQSEPRPPNLLLVMVDDLGPEWIGACGGEGIETPVIDGMAAGGMRFCNAYSMPKCTPTRVTLLTGQYPFHHGWVNHWDVPRWGGGCHFDPHRNASFARVLQDAGYATAIAGKWQINDFRVQPDVLAEHGFDEWCMWTGYETGNPPSSKRYQDPYVHTREGSGTRAGQFGTDVFADFLIDFMRRHRDEPMLLYFPMALTHGPLVATPSEPDVTEKLDKHRAMVRYVDHTMGRLLKAVDELGLRGDTITIFTTDNGTSRGITGVLDGRTVRGGKGQLGENGTREPFVVYGPGRVPAGVVTGCLTDFTDLFPTLVELAGAELPPDAAVDGRSIAQVMLGRDELGPREWILSMGGGVARLTTDGVVPAVPYAARVLRDRRYKIWVDESGRTTKVFDLRSDPGEEHDLIGSTDPSVLAARRKLEAVVRGLPARDAVPRYDPTPPQPWDRKPK